MGDLHAFHMIKKNYREHLEKHSKTSCQSIGLDQVWTTLREGAKPQRCHDNVEQAKRHTVSSNDHAQTRHPLMLHTHQTCMDMLTRYLH
jgi:hypothetical protein